MKKVSKLKGKTESDLETGFENKKAKRPANDVKKTGKAAADHTMWLENSSFDFNPPNKVIDVESCEPQKLPVDWGTKKGAQRAANQKNREKFARFMGHVKIHLESIDKATAKTLTAANPTDVDAFNDDGEYSTLAGTIPVSRLMDMEHNGDLEFISEEDRMLITSVFALQSPQSSQWNIPFIRVFSNHRYDPNRLTMTIKLYIYFTRLIFELIADSAIKCVMDRIEGVPVEVVRARHRPPQPAMFYSTGESLYNRDAYKYSLSGMIAKKNRIIWSTCFDFRKFSLKLKLSVNYIDFIRTRYNQP